MAWSYDVAKLAESEKDQIRLKIGDTDPEEPLLQDEEIQYYIDSTADLVRAALGCIAAVLTRISKDPDFRLGPYSENNANRIRALRTVRNELNAQVIGSSAPASQPPTSGPIFGYDFMSMPCDHIHWR